MAKPKTTAVPASHAQVMGGAAHAAMNQLRATGTQVVHTSDKDNGFAELQDEGPTARDPNPYATKPSGK